MAGKVRKIASVLLATVFVVSGALMVRQWLNERRALEAETVAREMIESINRTEVEETVDIFDQPVPLEMGAEKPVRDKETWLSDDTDFLLGIDLGLLRQTNEHVLGWIHSPGTVIDYPLLAYDDNKTGLDLAWDGTKNSAGSIFLECRNARDFSDFNTLVYGHNMRRGHMFGSLKEYAGQAYADEHRLIYIVTDDDVLVYEVFSAYEASVTSDTYRLYFEDDARRQSSLQHYVGSSVIGGNIVPTVEDRILTLSTCVGNGTYDTRWVVQAMLTAQVPR